MLMSETSAVVWNPRNKKHYTDLGYRFTKMGDSLEVDVQHLTKGSISPVKVRCDYCGKEYTIQWQVYMSIHRRSKLDSDACVDCGGKKAIDVIIKQYGSYSGFHLHTDKKRKETNIAKYGCENVFGSPIIQQRIVETNLNRYGVEYTQQSNVIRAKTEKTCFEKYGVNNYVELFRGKFIKENSPCWKGGVQASRVERATHEYHIWRTAVFERDHYTCASCGDHNGVGRGKLELHAHHISNWNDNKESRYDVNNGVTLCDKCHYRFHSIYGKRDNTLEQLQQFIVDNKVLDEKIC